MLFDVALCGEADSVAQGPLAKGLAMAPIMEMAMLTTRKVVGGIRNGDVVHDGRFIYTRLIR